MYREVEFGCKVGRSGAGVGRKSTVAGRQVIDRQLRGKLGSGSYYPAPSSSLRLEPLNCQLRFISY